MLPAHLYLLRLTCESVADVVRCVPFTTQVHTAVHRTGAQAEAVHSRIHTVRRRHRCLHQSMSRPVPLPTRLQTDTPHTLHAHVCDVQHSPPTHTHSPHTTCRALRPVVLFVVVLCPSGIVTPVMVLTGAGGGAGTGRVAVWTSSCVCVCVTSLTALMPYDQADCLSRVPVIDTLPASTWSDWGLWRLSLVVLWWGVEHLWCTVTLRLSVQM